ncbi:MAG: DHH family phosphoesterase [Lachnospiraceae bacterium]|nr:DHH family phosphoesterase [Lachnospiraceae bacterium]
MKKSSLNSQLDSFFRIPLKLLALLVIMMAALVMFDYNQRTAIIVGSGVAIYSIVAIIAYYAYKPKIMPELYNFAIEQGQVQRALLQQLAVPYVLMDMEGAILWHNKGFEELVDEDRLESDITSYFPTIALDMFPNSVDDTTQFTMGYMERQYKVVFKMIHEDVVSPDEDEEAFLSEFDGKDNNSLIVAYFFDETDFKKLQKDYVDQKLVAGLIYIDNYDEVLEGIEEARQPLLLALVDRKINKMVADIDGIIRKPEKDKYFIVFQQKYMEQLKADKFPLLDDIRNINVGNELPVTVSMSIGMGSSSFQECYEAARLSMDMALGRGGDQVVIKEGEKINYYGGQNTMIEKNTRVRARVKAHALQGILEGKDRVVIMGHHLPDADAIGSAIGVYILAKAFNKEAHICINETTVSIRPILDNFKNNSLYDDDMFIDNEKAKKLVNSDTLLMVVDVNRPSYTECPELLDMTKTIVVFDHHRQSEEIISNAVLSYVEPSASSACEMVAEVLQYTNQPIELSGMEADALYAGMMIDTGNFVQKTGARTFEAAAYLRRKGCDVVRVRKMFRDSMDACRHRAEAIRDAEQYRDHYVFAIFPTDGVDSPTVVASQVANELLDVEGIGASFVLSDIDGTIYISARSIDAVNVQVVMEKFGGGGHSNASGAQVKDGDPEEIIEQIKKILDEVDGVGEFMREEDE